MPTIAISPETSLIESLLADVKSAIPLRLLLGA